MSAYLCTSQHISAICNAYQALPKHHATAEGVLSHEERALVDKGHLYEHEALFTALTRHNLLSLAARYPREEATVKGWAVEPDAFKYDQRARFPSPIAAIKGVQCFAYQACEIADWDSSPVNRFCEGMISAYIRLLPGYEAAPWGGPGE